MTTILITGCLGFIGSHFVKYILDETDWNTIGFNRNSNQKNLYRLNDIYETNDSGEIYENDRFNLVYGDLSNNNCLSGICENIDYIVNFAAKTFVDHSIRDPAPFIQSNIVGTYNILEEARRSNLAYNNIKRFIQIGTDEVYGAILNGAYKEDARLNPTNPYSATKAASDMLALSYYNTYSLPIIITRTENNFGEYQHTQKAMPKFIKYALENRKLPVYGDGEHRRMWLYVKDHCSAIYHLLINGKNGEIYHVAGEQELTNNQLAKKILNILGKDESLIEHINDFNIRPGHDRRYALNVDKLKEIGWKPKYELDESLEKVVNWYDNNKWWLK